MPISSSSEKTPSAPLKPTAAARYLHKNAPVAVPYPTPKRCSAPSSKHTYFSCYWVASLLLVLSQLLNTCCAALALALGHPVRAEILAAYVVKLLDHLVQQVCDSHHAGAADSGPGCSRSKLCRRVCVVCMCGLEVAKLAWECDTLSRHLYTGTTWMAMCKVVVEVVAKVLELVCIGMKLVVGWMGDARAANAMQTSSGFSYSNWQHSVVDGWDALGVAGRLQQMIEQPDTASGCTGIVVLLWFCMLAHAWRADFNVFDAVSMTWALSLMVLALCAMVGERRRMIKRFRSGSSGTVERLRLETGRVEKTLLPKVRTKNGGLGSKLYDVLWSWYCVQSRMENLAADDDSSLCDMV